MSARLLSCTPTAHWLEYIDWWNPILAEPLRVENGMAILDDAVGSGWTGTKTRSSCGLIRDWLVAVHRQG